MSDEHQHSSPDVVVVSAPKPDAVARIDQDSELAPEIDQQSKVGKAVNVAVGLRITKSGVEFGTVQEALGYATACQSSKMLPKDIDTPQKAFAIMCRGAELGMKPWDSWSKIYLTKANRLAIQTKGAQALILASGLMEDYRAWIEHEDTDQMIACVYYKRRGVPTPVTKTFSISDARTAKLANEAGVKKTNQYGKEYDSTYDLFPKDMLLARAHGRAQEALFSDILGGILPQGIAEDADAAEKERRGATPAEARPVPAQGDPLADELRAQSKPQPQEAGKGGLDTGSTPSKQSARDTGTPPTVQGVTAGETASEAVVTQIRADRVQLAHELLGSRLIALAKDASEKRVQCDGNHGGPCCGDPECWRREEVVEVEPIIDDPLEGPVPPEKPRPKLQDGPAVPLFCGRCGMKTNAMGGCDVCGWPGSVDLR